MKKIYILTLVLISLSVILLYIFDPFNNNKDLPTKYVIGAIMIAILSQVFKERVNVAKIAYFTFLALCGLIIYFYFK